MPKCTLHDHGSTQQVWFFCPGCKNSHAFTIKAPAGPVWSFNGNYEKPTFTPSLMCNRDYPESRCHCFVTDGSIRFLNDCFHELAGKTVQLSEADKF